MESMEQILSSIWKGFRSFSERRNWLQLAENIFKHFSAPSSDANNLMISKKTKIIIARSFPQLAWTILYTCVLQISSGWRSDFCLINESVSFWAFPPFYDWADAWMLRAAAAHIKVSRDDKSLNVNFPSWSRPWVASPIKPISTPVLPN